jgi:hypothetical protein
MLHFVTVKHWNQTQRQLVFGKNMIFNIQHIGDWEYIKQKATNNQHQQLKRKCNLH